MLSKYGMGVGRTGMTIIVHTKLLVTITKIQVASHHTHTTL